MKSMCHTVDSSHGGHLHQFVVNAGKCQECHSLYCILTIHTYIHIYIHTYMFPPSMVQPKTTSPWEMTPCPLVTWQALLSVGIGYHGILFKLSMVEPDSHVAYQIYCKCIHSEYTIPGGPGLPTQRVTHLYNATSEPSCSSTKPTDLWYSKHANSSPCSIPSIKHYITLGC